ncbi:MAG: hypothetical protein MJ211_15860, partial [Bacteroidales bacterium]|nr:hypothetical protein [Bacteroidales bacterium]
MKKLLATSLLIITLCINSFGQYYSITFDIFNIYDWYTKTDENYKYINNYRLYVIEMLYDYTITYKDKSSKIYDEGTRMFVDDIGFHDIVLEKNEIKSIELNGMSVVPYPDNDIIERRVFNYRKYQVRLTSFIDSLIVTKQTSKDTENSWTYIEIKGSIYASRFHFSFSNHYKDSQNSTYLCQEDYVSIDYAFSLPVQSTLWYSLDNKNWKEFKTIEAYQKGTKITYKEVKDKGLIDKNFYIKLTYSSHYEYITEYPKKQICNPRDIDYDDENSVNIDKNNKNETSIIFHEDTKITEEELYVKDDSLYIPLSDSQSYVLEDFFNHGYDIANNDKHPKKVLVFEGHPYELKITEQVNTKCPVTKYLYAPKVVYNKINNSDNVFWYYGEKRDSVMSLEFYFPNDTTSNQNINYNQYYNIDYNNANANTFSSTTSDEKKELRVLNDKGSGETDVYQIKNHKYQISADASLTQITLKPQENSNLIKIIKNIKLEAYKKISWTIKPTIT